MRAHPDTYLRELRQRVSDDEYRVDTRAVAEVIVRRRWKVAIAPRPAQTSVIASPASGQVHALAA